MHIRIDIPPRPEILIELSREVRKDSPSVPAIAVMLAKDVSLAGGILSLANSPRFAGRGKFSSIKEAVIYLGLNALTSFASGVLLKKALSGDPVLMKFFWEKSTAIADECAEVSSHEFFKKYRLNPSEIYTFGLFRDCGQAILVLNFKEYLQKVGDTKIDPCNCLASAEETLFNISHSKPGYMLCIYWDMHETFCLAVRDHHDPSCYLLDGQATSLEKILYMSIGHIGHMKYLLKKKSYNKEKDQILPEMMKTLEMGLDTLKSIIGEDIFPDELLVPTEN